jgi:hypothetical protein
VPLPPPPDGPRAPAPQQGAPHGITLFDHAEIAALIAEGDRPMEAVLAARGLTVDQWNESTIHWMGRMGDDVLEKGQDARVPILYSDAFGKAQDAIKPAPEMDPASYAKLVVDVQRAGGPAEPLAARGLSTADYLRLSRRFAVLLSSDAEASRAFFETYEALHAEAPPEPSDEG